MKPMRPRRLWHPAFTAAVAATMLAAVAGCGDPSDAGHAAPVASTPVSAAGAASPTPSASPATSASATPSASASTTSGGTLTKRFMGSSRVLIGAAMEDASAKAAPWDLRYVYVHSQPAQSSSWYSASRCQDAWTGWWGCWTGSTTVPGTYVTYRLDQAAKATYQGRPRPQKFFFTWYSLRGLGEAAGKPDGPEEVVAINRLDLLTRYLNDYRFFLQKIGKSHAAIDLEPDFWGFARSLGNLHQVPARVKGANPTDCGSQENSAAGLARCLMAMTRKYAPNTAVGLHLSCFDWEWSIQKCVKDYADLGAKNGDFLVTDVSDRDAGWYAQPAHGSRNTFWTDQKAAAALKYYKTMAESVGKPVVLWQIPVGNMAQNNTP